MVLGERPRYLARDGVVAVRGVGQSRGRAVDDTLVRPREVTAVERASD